MAYSITLSDEEYAALSAIAAERGQPIESLVHEALAERYTRHGGSDNSDMQADPLIASMLRAGHLRHAPNRIAESQAERAERERLAASVRQGKRASEMVIEDRGPR